MLRYSLSRSLAVIVSTDKRVWASLSECTDCYLSQRNAQHSAGYVETKPYSIKCWYGDLQAAMIHTIWLYYVICVRRPWQNFMPARIWNFHIVSVIKVAKWSIITKQCRALLTDGPGCGLSEILLRYATSIKAIVNENSSVNGTIINASKARTSMPLVFHFMEWTYNASTLQLFCRHTA